MILKTKKELVEFCNSKRLNGSYMNKGLQN